MSHRTETVDRDHVEAAVDHVLANIRKLADQPGVDLDAALAEQRNHLLRLLFGSHPEYREARR